MAEQAGSAGDRQRQRAKVVVGRRAARKQAAGKTQVRATRAASLRSQESPKKQ